MKLTILKAEIESMLAAVSLTADRKPLRPVLAGVKMEADGTKLTCRTHRLESSMVASTHAVQIVSPGAFIASVDMLIKIFASITDEWIDFSVEKGRLFVRSASAQFDLTSLAVQGADLPPHGESLDGAKFTVKASSFLRAIRRVSFAAGATDGRYMSNVIAILPGKPAKVSGASSRCVAIDSLDTSLDAKEPVLIPSSSEKALSVILAEAGNDDVEIYVSENTATFVMADRQFTTVLAEGRFPPVEQIIPTDSNIKGNIGVAELVRCLSSASMFTTEQQKGVTLDIKGGSIEVSAANDTGGAKVRTTTGITGEIKMVFNPALLLPAFKSAMQDLVDIEFVNPTRPMVIRDGNRVVCVSQIG